jgi:hypothetical protein
MFLVPFAFFSLKSSYKYVTNSSTNPMLMQISATLKTGKLHPKI